jgi:hypothetical protein
MFDEELLDHPERLLHRDETRLLWHLATAGAQVRRAIELREEVGIPQLSGELPRALLVATDAPRCIHCRPTCIRTRPAGPS